MNINQLPIWDDAARKPEGERTALEQFIYKQEPANLPGRATDAEFREGLAALITEAVTPYRAALQRADALCSYALDKFDWGASALDAKAIQLLNEVPGEIRKALVEGQS